jgi:hypothetical protein
MPCALPINEDWRVEHYLARAEERGDCLCIGNGSYYPTWTKPLEHKSERLAQLVCRVVHGPRPGEVPSAPGPGPSGSALVMHSCDNKACIRPEHLSWGTQVLNLQDAYRKGRVAPPVVDMGARVREGKHHWARLQPDDIAAIRARLAKGERQASIAADFAVSFQQISKIKLGRRWRHL